MDDYFNEFITNMQMVQYLCICVSAPFIELGLNWQFSCVRKLRNYYSFIRIHGEYFLIKYTLHGVEIARKKVEYSNVKNNFPIVGVARDRFLILNYSTREVKEVMFD